MGDTCRQAQFGNGMKAIPIDLTTVQKVLIIKLSSIGDVVHALPVSAALKRTFPHLHLGWVVEDRNAALVEGNPYLDEIIMIPRLQWRPRRYHPSTWIAAVRMGLRLRSKHYEVALDLQGLRRSALWVLWSGARVRLGYNRLQQGTHFVLQRVPKRPESVHVVDQYLDVARALGARGEPIVFPFWIPEEAKQHAASLLQEVGVDPRQAFVVLNPSSEREWKRWALDHFAVLSDRLEVERQMPAVFVGGPGDVPLIERLQSYKREPLRSLIGRTSLKELAALLAICSVHVCGDTGSGHMAAALQVPCVSLFGPTDPDRSCPYGQRDRVLCKRNECQRCPVGTCQYDECLQWITVEEVVDQIARCLGDRVKGEG